MWFIARVLRRFGLLKPQSIVGFSLAQVRLWLRLTGYRYHIVSMSPYAFRFMVPKSGQSFIALELQTPEWEIPNEVKPWSKQHYLITFAERNARDCHVVNAYFAR